MARKLWRHHPADAGARWQWPAVVGPDISLAPSAGSAPTPALYVSNSLGGLEAINQQGRFMVTRPIAFALAATIDEELANAVRSNRLYREGLCVHPWSLQKKMARNDVRRYGTKVRNPTFNSSILTWGCTGFLSCHFDA